MNNRMSIVDHPVPDIHSQRIQIRTLNGIWSIASFDREEQLDRFAQTVGFTYQLVEEHQHPQFGIYREYCIDRKIQDAFMGGFCKKEDLPADAKPIMALSNGNIVTCYFTNDGEQITFFRPNPNAKDIYHPLSTPDHIRHQMIYGIY